MTKRMLIDALHPEEMRVVIADEKQIFDFDFASTAKQQIKGNIYLAKITRVEPSLQAAFVEYGGGKQGFLPFAEIHPDYYQIPISDRKRLMEEASGDAGEPDMNPETNGDNAEVGDATPDEAALPAALLAERLPEISVDAPPPAPEEPASEEQAPREGGFAISEIVERQDVENAELAESLNPPANEEKKEDDLSSEASAKEDDVETLASDEEEISQNRKRNNFFRRYKIQEVIKRGQVVLVQVIKEERGNKGCSLTSFLSLPGRYCVLMPNSPKDGGISRKISDSTTRKRLKEVLSELTLANGMSVIIRTAGIDRTRAEIRRDFDYLVKLWNQIREDTLGSTAPALIYEESDLIKRSIRDQYTSDIDEVVVEGEAAFRSARDFMKMLLPSHTPRVKQYSEGMPLFYAYGVEDQMLSMHDPVVKLKSGGYIVINPTEALISIDVNSGRATGERNIEETATRTNLEAAAEVARQLRLRDLAGLIVIDFIDMYESRNRRNVERSLKDALKSDRAKIQLGRISPFGLLEMSRQRLRPSIAETNNIPCPHCNGRGAMRSNESMSIQVVRALEKEAATGQWQILKLNAPETTALHLLNTKRGLLDGIEQRYGVTISVQIDHSLTASAYTIEKNRRGNNAPRERSFDNEEAPKRDRGPRSRRPREREREKEEVIESPTLEDTENTSVETVEGEGSSEESRARRRGRRGGRNRRRGGKEGSPEENGASPESTEQESTEAVEPAPESEGDTAKPARTRGRRGGRRRWKDGEERESGEAQSSNAASADAEALPAFTRARVLDDTPKPAPVSYEPPQPIPTAAPAPSTARPEGAPPRKGWWQKIIELD